MIQVTKAFLPDFEEYTNYLRTIWDKGQLTNNGSLLQELEKQLKEHLGVKHLIFCSNGTIVLQMAIKVLGITKEIITTPFSYCASSTAILWEKCTPVYADINPLDFCIDPVDVERKITENTEAILATHVYGNPCKLEALQLIADKYRLRIIYDAAHAFGVSIEGRSLLNFGDISTCSFHATKVFHTVEGGAIVTNDDEIARQLKLFRSFGHINDDYYLAGINAKNSEFHAAMGLCNLPQLPTIIARRKEISELYQQELSSKILTSKPASIHKLSYNYAYFPVVFTSEESLLCVMEALKSQEIMPRRYFYPSLNTLPYLQKKQPCPVSEDIAKRVLCLPLYVELSNQDVLRIISIVNESV